MKKKSAPKRKKVTSKSNSKKKGFLFWHRGTSSIIYLFLGVIIFGAFLIAGGVGNFQFTNDPNPQVGELVIEESNPKRDNLQLQTLRFKQCSSQLTVDLLLDVSGSMADPTETNVSKISRLRQAVSNLTNQLNDNSIIGIQTFRGTGATGTTPQSQLIDLVPISYYKDVKSILPSRINSLSASGATPTHDALAFSYQKLQEAVAKYPDRKFNFILISDGAPCPGVGCAGIPGQNQDPRLYSPNPIDQIKALGVNVYTIGIYDRGQARDTNLENLLITIASKPENYKNAGAGDSIDPILKEVAEKICSDPTGSGITPSPTP